MQHFDIRNISDNVFIEATECTCACAERTHTIMLTLQYLAVYNVDPKTKRMYDVRVLSTLASEVATIDDLYLCMIY